jgi:uncharacterized membrane protein YgaE (UPF0421/DUF939 family)
MSYSASIACAAGVAAAGFFAPDMGISEAPIKEIVGLGGAGIVLWLMLKRDEKVRTEHNEVTKSIATDFKDTTKAISKDFAETTTTLLAKQQEFIMDITQGNKQ